MTFTKENFNEAVSHIKKDGIASFLGWLNTTDFFTAPASTNFHGNYEEGLLDHTMYVLKFALLNFNMIVKQNPDLEYLRESVIICALFHDVCKTNYYHLEKKWTKDENGKWKDYIGYKVADTFPIGHGEKSVYLISKYMNLTDAEAMAIRWHMSWTEPSTIIQNTPQYYAFNQAIDHPLVRLIIAVDILAISLEEKKDLKTI